MITKDKKNRFVDISPLNKQIKAEGNLEYCKIIDSL